MPNGERTVPLPQSAEETSAQLLRNLEATAAIEELMKTPEGNWIRDVYGNIYKEGQDILPESIIQPTAKYRTLLSRIPKAGILGSALLPPSTGLGLRLLLQLGIPALGHMQQVYQMREGKFPTRGILPTFQDVSPGMSVTLPESETGFFPERIPPASRAALEYAPKPEVEAPEDTSLMGKLGFTKEAWQSKSKGEKALMGLWGALMLAQLFTAKKDAPWVGGSKETFLTERASTPW